MARVADAWRARLLMQPLEAVVAARGQLFPFAAVAFGIGIALWFGWRGAPQAWEYAAALVLMVAGAALFLMAPDPAWPFGALILALAAGFLAAGLRAGLVAAPVLDWRYYGPVEGRVVEIDRSTSDAIRLTLDRVVLERLAPARTPALVRISLHGARQWHVPAPGETVILTAHLAPPPGPVEPDGFDFRRMAYFDRLGAIGYSRTPVLLLEPPATGEAWIGRLRAHLSGAIRARIPGEAGAFAAAAMTGDRSGIGQATVEALRDSSLAHILAISGMNLAFLVGFVFALVRGAVALVPPLALRLDAKKTSALISLGVAYFYLLLSGANVATERAFYMVVVMLGAVLLDRRAITLRSASLAAVLLLGLQPESLLEPGFQMSFAATVALIAGFQALDRHLLAGRGWPGWALVLFTGFASSVIGGLATAPYAAAHFNRFADLGLLANLLTVPAMGLAIMPMGVLAFLLAPLGLEAVPLWLMGLGAEWILRVAHWIAGLEGAVTGIPAPGAGALAVMTLGGLWLILWPGRARLAGGLAIAAGLALWPLAARPLLLISPDGRLAGWLGPEGRVLSSARGGGFAAQTWLENDGDLVDQQAAAGRAGFTGPPAARALRLDRYRLVILTGKAGLAALPEACATADLVILAAEAPVPLPPCALIDGRMLKGTGAIAIRRSETGLELVPTGHEGQPWQGRRADLAGLRAVLPKGIALVLPP